MDTQRLVRLCAHAGLIGLTSAVAGAQSPTNPLQVGMFGSSEYGRTSRNFYKDADEDGAFETVRFGLRLHAPVNDRVSISSLVLWEQHEGNRSQDVRYAFATVRLSRGFDLRFGKVKHPGSLYSEVFDIGTVRPFLSLPEAIYGAAGNALESYTGVGVKGQFDAGPLVARVDAYVGGGALRYRSARLDLIPNFTQQVQRVELRDLVGARLGLSPLALTDLSVSVGAAQFHSGFCPGVGGVCIEGVAAEYRSAQLEYAGPRASLRAEFTHQKSAGTYHNDAYYVEGAFFLTRRVQVAAQTNWLHDRFEIPIPLPASLVDPLDRHEEFGLGLNYWLSPDVVVKSSWATIDGNRFARPGPEALQRALQTLQVPSSTRLFQVGMQFTW